MANDEIYYAHAGALPLARRLSYIARARIVDQILAILKPTASTTLLDIGTSDNTSFESNMMQQRYPYRESMTCASLSDGLTITQAYPGVKHVRIQPNVRLPFCDGQFDCAYSNAVIEHCGNRTQQSFFIDEVCRVSRSQFIIAPNPYFPVEHHTGLPLLHLLPKRVFRFILSQSKWCYWSTEQNLNYITKKETIRLWPSGRPHSQYCGIGYGLFSSNFMVYQIGSTANEESCRGSL